MTPSRVARVLVLLLLLAPAVYAAEDFTGKWGGSFTITQPDGSTSQATAHLVVKQTGADLAGTIGPNPDEQYPILKGKVETAKEGPKEVTTLAFDVDHDGTMVHFVLTFADSHLKGTAKATRDGEALNAALDLTRIKN